MCRRSLSATLDSLLLISNVVWTGDARVCIVFYTGPAVSEYVSTEYGSVQMRWYGSEGLMLAAWQQFVRREVDPGVFSAVCVHACVRGCVCVCVSVCVCACECGCVHTDVLTGFDVCGFDLRFILERFRVLKVGPLDLSRCAAPTKLSVQVCVCASVSV